VSIRVESFGLLTTIQDLGRRGFQHLGVGPGGAMDEASHRMANLLVGNPDPAPSLEMTLTGPNLQFETESMIALCGADLSPTIADQPVPLWRPVMVGAGSLLKFGRPAQGARCYLAVAGGFQVPKVMGSASTHLSALSFSHKAGILFLPELWSKADRAAARHGRRRSVAALRVQHHPSMDRISCDHEVAGDQISSRAGSARQADRPHHGRPACRVERRGILAYVCMDTGVRTIIAERR